MHFNVHVRNIGFPVYEVTERERQLFWKWYIANLALQLHKLNLDFDKNDFINFNYDAPALLSIESLKVLNVPTVLKSYEQQVYAARSDPFYIVSTWIIVTFVAMLSMYYARRLLSSRSIKL